ncbi:hypothetical protein CLOSTMETH_00348 [[Clostridium] methylpentosum DSM 5476]|uniref:Uncharacterized protein n=1 Tax=[Clostridium] methylpentosum DSM 5476 TaxID=537013 RepID=C0E953_9FIRM|nr:hypothetical protein CLOSTMETH_00348 [[Clostridium] methylpentosum DSM 5476]
MNTPKWSFIKTQISLQKTGIFESWKSRVMPIGLITDATITFM